MPFLSKFGPKNQNVCIGWMVPSLLQICWIWWWCSLFCFEQEISFLRAKLSPKKSKLAVQAEIWYVDYFKHAESDCVVHFVCFRLEILILCKFGPKIQNCFLRLKFGTKTNSNALNSTVLFVFCFGGEISFLEKLLKFLFKLLFKLFNLTVFV